MQYDLIIHNAQLHRHSGMVEIAVQDGRFARISSEIPPGSSATREIDAGGPRKPPSFIDAHVHLDAVLTVGQPRYNTTGTLLEGIQIWSERKPSLTREDVKKRALEEIPWEVAQGTLHIRSHVDVCDPSLTALRALIEVRAEVRDICNLQLVAFPQDGIFSFPDGRELMRQAMGTGLRSRWRHSTLRMDTRYGRRRCPLCLCSCLRVRPRIDCHCDETDDPHSRFTERCI